MNDRMSSLIGPFMLLMGLVLAGGAWGADTLTMTVSGESLTVMKSPWADYFGTHYASTPEGASTTWNTVRSYGGPHIGVHIDENLTAPIQKGPFTGKEIRIALGDFRMGDREKSAEQLIPELIANHITGIYLANEIVRPGTEGFDKDRFYWVVRMIHEQFPEAYRQVVWQIGNEVVSGHFDPKDVWKSLSKEDRQRNQKKEDNFFGYNLAWKEEFYVNEYLAPAIEAIERASIDIYGDPQRIQIALGSMNPYNKQNLAFLKNVMERRFNSRQASTLNGEEVWKHFDLLTVHYMTGSAHTIDTLQLYLDQYVKTGKVKGLWITEDHGAAGRGPVTIIANGLRFLGWAARNDLSAEQTRLCWWGEGERDPGGRGKEATALLGQFFAGCPLHFSERPVHNGTVYLLADGQDNRVRRILIAVVPDRGSSIHLDNLQIQLPSTKPPPQWDLEAIQYSSTKPGERLAPGFKANGTALDIALNRDIGEPCILLLKSK